MMAPILDDLRKEFAEKLDVEFIDVGFGQPIAPVKQYGIKVIPTQIFFGADGKELWRHEDYISRFGILDKWRELGYEFAAKALEPAFSRLEPLKPDARPKERICHLCDSDIDAKTLVVVKTEKGDVRLCGPRCYFIMYSCLLEEKAGFEKRVSATDWETGKLVAATEVTYLQGLDEKTGRPWTRAFSSREAAVKERGMSGGSLVLWHALAKRELAVRCGFCDRAVYPEDAATVKVDGFYSWGCCSHCALGVAARMGKDIEVFQPDRLTGETVVVRTLAGYVGSVEPKTAVAWFGLRKAADGKFVSAGCFHQGFFTCPENLKKWVEQNPATVGKMISIDQALGDKMKMSPQQIQKACKIGECVPK
jgi:hypothetical protein